MVGVLRLMITRSERSLNAPKGSMCDLFSAGMSPKRLVRMHVRNPLQHPAISGSFTSHQPTFPWHRLDKEALLKSIQDANWYCGTIPSARMSMARTFVEMSLFLFLKELPSEIMIEKPYQEQRVLTTHF